jgi:hypothetical protein
VIRHEDPIRKARPTYALADPYLQFHYAVLEPQRSRLRSRDPRTLSAKRLTEVLDSQVRGPVFEQLARTFVERFASDDTVPGERAHVGPSRLTSQGSEWELDLVVTDHHAALVSTWSCRSRSPSAALRSDSSPRRAASAPRSRRGVCWNATYPDELTRRQATDRR